MFFCRLRPSRRRHSIAGDNPELVANSSSMVITCVLYMLCVCSDVGCCSSGHGLRCIAHFGYWLQNLQLHETCPTHVHATSFVSTERRLIIYGSLSYAHCRLILSCFVCSHLLTRVHIQAATMYSNCFEQRFAAQGRLSVLLSRVAPSTCANVGRSAGREGH